MIADVTWEFYESFVESIADGENIRVAFDGKDIEATTLGPFHESLGGIVAVFIATIATELGIEHQQVGSTTWKRKKRRARRRLGFVLLLRPRKAGDIHGSVRAAIEQSGGLPQPRSRDRDHISRSKIDRPGIYAVLKVPELWRFHKEQFSIKHLGPGGAHRRRTGAVSCAVRPDYITAGFWNNNLPGACVARAAARVGSR